MEVNNDDNNLNVINNEVNVVKNKGSKNIVIIFVIIIVVVLALGSFVWFYTQKDKMVAAKDVEKTLYIYSRTDKNDSSEAGYLITDIKDSITSDEVYDVEFLNTFDCVTKCTYAGTNIYSDTKPAALIRMSYKPAIYDDAKLYAYNEVSKKMKKIEKTNEYNIKGYQFITYGNYLVAKKDNFTNIDYESVSLEIDSGISVLASLNTLKNNMIAESDNGNTSFYKNSTLFLERKDSEVYYFDYQQGFYVSFLDEDNTLIFTENKTVINDNAYIDHYSIYDNKLLAIIDESINIYSSAGELLSTISQVEPAGIYEHFSPVIVNNELQIIDVLTNQTIYNFGQILEHERINHGQFFETYIEYINENGKHTLSIFLEDESRPISDEPLENGDNMLGRRFTYDFNTNEGTVEDASALNPFYT